MQARREALRRLRLARDVPGRHTFSVRATDEAGNLGPAEQASFRFKRKR